MLGIGVYVVYLTQDFVANQQILWMAHEVHYKFLIPVYVDGSTT